jgi:site-specific recombinase XerD
MSQLPSQLSARRAQTIRYFTDPLYSRMADDLQLAGMSQRTHDGYLRAVRQLADFCQTPPERISEAQLRRYFLHLKCEKQFASGSLRVAYAGIKFFYTRTCQRPWATLAQMKVQQVKSLPEVLTIAQVRQIINAATTQRIAVYFWTVYSLGLRMQEGLNLQVGDIDAARGMVHVHRGKGAKDRYVPLPTSTLQWLREYWLTHRHRRLLFPAEGRDHQGSSTAATPMSPTSVQGAMKKITTQIDFGKKVSLHTLRHSYGTHLLEAGVSLRAIQQYLGHSSLQTTMVYLHLTDSAAVDIRQTIEKLFRRG